MLDLAREYKYMKADIDRAIHRCLTHQKWILGPEVGEFEEKCAQYLSVKHCIGVSSGTDALIISLRALAIHLTGKEYFSREHKIITTPFTFTATGSAILRGGATPVFVDIDPQTFNIDPQAIEAYLKTKPKNVAGIIPVHLYGQACDMDKILSIARRHKLAVIEDTAQAFGGEWKGRRLGGLGDFGAFSFFPSKNLGGFGDGGMIATNNNTFAQTARMLAKHGGKDKYNADHIGYNARLDTLQAGILLAKMRYLDQFNNKRRIIARTYQSHLKKITGLILPKTSTDGRHIFHQYTIRVTRSQRNSLQEYLKSKGVDTMIYYPVALHKMKIFIKNCLLGSALSTTEKACDEVLSLPTEPLMTKQEIREIARHIKDGLK